LRIYCDMNIYNRCFDDQSQLRIRLETGAIEGIFELAESGGLELVWSFMLDYENSLNPQDERKEWAELLSQLCIHTIVPSPRILALARALIKNARIRPRDALHVACAETGRCDHFVTCDDDLVRTVRTRRRAPKLRVIATNPVEFIRRQGGSHG
jgi:predicted nucleic acid-binding protein